MDFGVLENFIKAANLFYLHNTTFVNLWMKWVRQKADNRSLDLLEGSYGCKPVGFHSRPQWINMPDDQLIAGHSMVRP
jgi:hypothetical protein